MTSGLLGFGERSGLCPSASCLAFWTMRCSSILQPFSRGTKITIAPSSFGCCVGAQSQASSDGSATNASESATATYRPRD
jgi:hypothetical protein